MLLPTGAPPVRATTVGVAGFPSGRLQELCEKAQEEVPEEAVLPTYAFHTPEPVPATA